LGILLIFHKHISGQNVFPSDCPELTVPYAYAAPLLPSYSPPLPLALSVISPPSHHESVPENQLVGLGARCKLSQLVGSMVRGRAPAAVVFAALCARKTHQVSGIFTVGPLGPCPP